MSGYHVVGWSSDHARLRSFVAQTKSKGGTTLKIELEVLDNYKLAHLLDVLGRIRDEQDAAARAACPAPSRPAPSPGRKPRRAALARQAPPLLLSYREERDD